MEKEFVVALKGTKLGKCIPLDNYEVLLFYVLKSKVCRHLVQPTASLSFGDMLLKGRGQRSVRYNFAALSLMILDHVSILLLRVTFSGNRPRLIEPGNSGGVHRKTSLEFDVSGHCFTRFFHFKIFLDCGHSHRTRVALFFIVENCDENQSSEITDLGIRF